MLSRSRLFGILYLFTLILLLVFATLFFKNLFKDEVAPENVVTKDEPIEEVIKIIEEDFDMARIKTVFNSDVGTTTVFTVNKDGKVRRLGDVMGDLNANNVELDKLVFLPRFFKVNGVEFKQTLEVNK